MTCRDDENIRLRPSIHHFLEHIEGALQFNPTSTSSGRAPVEINVSRSLMPHPSSLARGSISGPLSVAYRPIISRCYQREGTILENVPTIKSENVNPPNLIYEIENEGFLQKEVSTNHQDSPNTRQREQGYEEEYMKWQERLLEQSVNDKEQSESLGPCKISSCWDGEIQASWFLHSQSSVNPNVVHSYISIPPAWSHNRDPNSSALYERFYL
jgi:hypothetical protein